MNNLALVLSWKVGHADQWKVDVPLNSEAFIAEWSVPGQPKPDAGTLEEWTAQWEAATGGLVGLAKASAKARINELLDTAVNQHPSVAKYPQAEQKSFEIQEQEATAWLKDNSAATPFIDVFVQGSTTWNGKKAELCAEIIKNNQVDRVLMAMVATAREAFHKGVDACANTEEVTAFLAAVPEQINKL